MSGEQALADLLPWIHSRLGYVFGNDGKGGSGTAIQLADGSEAILTAQHVVIDCILTGAMTIGRVGDTQASIPKRIRIASRTDAACISISTPNPFRAKLSFAEWANPQSNLSAGLAVLPSGVPGDWKRIDAEKNAIPFLKALVYRTTLSDPPKRGDIIICNINERDAQLPESFGGMSGGPLFTWDRKFLGVLIKENRRIGGGNRGEILVTPAEKLEELYGHLQLPFLTDYTRQRVQGFFPVVELQGRKRTSQLEVNGDMYWSQSHPESSFGRIQMIRFLAPDGAEEYPINMDSFYRPNDDTEVERKRAFDEEVRFLLGHIGWGIEGPTL